MKRKTRWAGYVLIILAWVLIVVYNENHYSEDSFITDQWFQIGLWLFTMYWVGLWSWEKLQSKAKQCIWPGGKCNIDTAKFIDFEAYKDKDTGKLMYEKHVGIKVNSWFAPGVYHHEGGKEQGYLIVPERAIIHYQNHIALNISDMEWFVGYDKHLELPKHMREKLIQHCIEVYGTWEDDWKIGWGLIPYHKTIKGEIAGALDFKNSLKALHRRVAELEMENKAWRKKYIKVMKIDKDEVRPIPAPAWKKEEEEEKKEKKD